MVIDFDYKRPRVALCLILMLLMVPGSVLAQDDLTALDQDVLVDLHPATTLVASDFKYDNGEQLNLSWVPSIDDIPEVGIVTGYQFLEF